MVNKRSFFAIGGFIFLAGVVLSAPISAQNPNGDNGAKKDHLSNMSMQDRVELLTRRVSAMSEQAKGLKAAEGSAGDCRESFSLDAATGNPNFSKHLRSSSAVLTAWTLYEACRSVEAADPQRFCGDDPHYLHVDAGGDRAGDSSGSLPFAGAQCRDVYWSVMRARMVQAAASQRASTMGLCTSMFDDQIYARKNLPRVAPGSFCDAYLSHADDPHQRVQSMFQLLRASPQYQHRFKASALARRETLEASYNGQLDQATCAADFSDAKDVLRFNVCLAANGYRQALQAQNPASCGGSGLCLALFGADKTSCKSEGDALRDAYCANSDAVRRELMTQIEGTQKDLSATVSSLSPNDADEMSVVRALMGRVVRMRQELAGRQVPPPMH